MLLLVSAWTRGDIVGASRLWFTVPDGSIITLVLDYWYESQNPESVGPLIRSLGDSSSLLVDVRQSKIDWLPVHLHGIHSKLIYVTASDINIVVQETNVTQ